MTIHRHIDYIHRKTGSEDIYFVSNSSESTEKIISTFRVDQDMVPEIWDPVSGLIERNVEFSKNSGGISIDLVMEPITSYFVVFRRGVPDEDDAGMISNLQFGSVHKDQRISKKERIDLSKDWTVYFDSAMGDPDSASFAELISWDQRDEDGIRYYSGTAVYSRKITLGENALDNYDKAFISFTDIQEVARVIINGNDCGIIWSPPYTAEITPYLEPGTNHIEVQVVNTWNNRIVGDVRNPDKKSYTNTIIKNKFNEKSPLLKSGMTGNAEIILISE